MKTKKSTQQGMVAIMVTAIIMVIMSLITLGFARLVQREQRQGLDSQLSTQAFYAAESGVNAVAARITDATPAPEKPDCDVTTYNNGEIDPATPDVRFTCIMIDPTPDSLVFNNGSIKSDRSKVVPIIASPGVNSMFFRWTDANPTRVNFDNSCSIENRNSATDWAAANRVGMLQVDIIPVSIAVPAAFDRETVTNNTATLMFYPCGGGTAASVPYSSFVSGNASGANRGNVAPVNCNGSVTPPSYRCNIEVTGLPAGTDFYVRVKSVYSDLNVEINGESAAGVRSSFANAQVVVDSTGRANDVLRRVQVRLPIYKQYTIPEAALQSQNGICKRYTIVGSVVSNPACP